MTYMKHVYTLFPPLLVHTSIGSSSDGSSADDGIGDLAFIYSLHEDFFETVLFSVLVNGWLIFSLLKTGKP